ncbi:MAG: TlpA family protein disulfide reductase [Chloroflexia bacterium]|nr:TlpA family protein disulfide reductase [Chloroflexia bacterium]
MDSLPPHPDADDRGVRPFPRLLGLGLLLGGGLLGLLLALSVMLYRAPAGGSAPPVSAAPPPETVARLSAASPETRAAPGASPTRTPRPLRPAVGQKAPPFRLPDLEGVEHNPAEYRGRPVLLHFWASWSPSCRQGWGELVRFAASGAPSHPVIIAVNVQEPWEVVQNFVGQEALPFYLLLDHQGRVNSTYGITVLPTTFLLDREGIIRQVVPGEISAESLRILVKSLDLP